MEGQELKMMTILTWVLIGINLVNTGFNLIVISYDIIIELINKILKLRKDYTKKMLIKDKIENL